MATSKLPFVRPSTELRKSGKVVGSTDRVYDLSSGTVRFDEIEVKGDLWGDLDYNGRKVRVTRVDEVIGLLLTPSGARGPLWKGVDVEVLA